MKGSELMHKIIFVAALAVGTDHGANAATRINPAAQQQASTPDKNGKIKKSQVPGRPRRRER
jgi:hypothetical protein